MKEDLNVEPEIIFKLRSQQDIVRSVIGQFINSNEAAIIKFDTKARITRQDR